ncbi:unnamed protein product [Brachionus calyciflorus]|uniref:Conserved oligomeric Golgi complex subunit 3 n=1 Tax=Brachionus calyciflorus TaxID=104777 RepID=A0A813P299_9BILA|nr:unnamed protein product [Brachionus calyciflorus]
MESIQQRIDRDALVKENISKWDELSCLSEEQVKSVLLLTQLNQFQLDDDQLLDDLASDSNEGKEANKQPVSIHQDINELLYNFDVNDIEDPKIEKYVNNLSKNSKKCAIISDTISEALNHLNLLLDNYSQVSQKTKSLHVACEQLLNDQTKLVNASYLLNSRLSYFTDMEAFMQKLNSPTIENNCEYIIPMLTRIDECLAYLEANPSHKESSSYTQIVLQVLRKALSIVRTYTINSLTSVTNQIMQSIQESSNPVVKFSADNAYTMFYSRFRINSSRIKTLMEQLEQRVELNNQKFIDYEHCLADCHKCYIQQRKVFIYQSVVNAINELVSKYQRDTSSLVRSSCSFMIHLCNDETQLYKNFFNKTSIFFEQFLEELCLVLYDRLRPIIIHVVHIETLAELCSILKTEILMDKNKDNNSTNVFEGICSQMLEDVQERFVYRTHIYIREEILNYNCSSGDISYPEKLEIMQQIAEKIKSQSSDSESSLSSDRLSAQDQHGMWYPTLRRTLICLSKLYRCLDKKIFEGLAQETLTICIQSLVKAAEMIRKNKTNNDSELFLIKHLLILREQISPFNNEFSVAEVQLDFSRIKDAAFSLINKKNNIFRLNRDNAFLDFLLNGTLEAKVNMVDSKREVDNHLKKTCEIFIQNASDDFFGSIRQLVIKIQAVLNMNSDPNAPKVILSQQPFAKPEKLHDIIAENYKDIKKKLPMLSQKMSLYLSNKEIEQIILKRVKNNMQQVYLDMSQIVQKNYNQEDQLIIACPTPEQISLWMTIV